MRAFRFRLERVLELRRYAEKAAEAALAAKVGACAALDLQLRENAERTHKLTAERFRLGASLDDYRASERFGQRLQQERERCLKALALAEAERETARLAYVAARRASELIDKLRERGAAAWRKDALRAETAVLDDLGSQSRQRRRAQAGVVPEINRG
ncbi:MAG: flagellar export protein FliJ [Spirochaetes bacterium GWD1_61_31]|nr:MAG: flagellar export protein FliJ [Spirochaetes bacterium GWB1_60_80]OHD42177.1 MAG: flagellar export protein FliJ [Spirochaetes bacterium GWD1_61_31]OHD44507.1 MAG: flagellar export protein FliJ [Spirochaetes bacterium GWE1_60_18]OHD59341.1 MAG: flagellar export protein FliJ [Spirochaetes bacterium GWF1_60_12]HAP43162.1 flagellar export protein FliJ [Spirochaetaceae bacterium]